MTMTTGDNIFGFTRSYLGMVTLEWIAVTIFVIMYCADVIVALHHFL